MQIRRNTALFLYAVGSRYYDRQQPPADLKPYLAALTVALRDADSRVRELSAQVVGIIGPSASSAVPALIALLARRPAMRAPPLMRHWFGIGLARNLLERVRPATSKV